MNSAVKKFGVNKKIWLLLALVSPSVWAQVSGVVRSPAGDPIAGVEVEVVGANISIRADTQGHFVLPEVNSNELELHVKAPMYMHKTFHLDARKEQQLELVLNPTVMEVISVIGLPWHASNMESAQPVNVLSGERLRDRQAVTLGDTLNYEVGVHSSYYGPVASSPIIRGLEGPRVLVTQNGLDVGDASRVGPDHAVATEASTARQIEILRGPATLFYGSGAIGGVVNIVDDRVPQSNDTEGEWRVQSSSVANDHLASGSITTGTGNIAVHADAFWRESDDYKIPGPAESGAEHGGRQRLENSATRAKGVNLGGSYLLDNGFIGVSVGRLERDYGIPGHTHSHSYSHNHSHEESEQHGVLANLKQDRVQLISELTLENAWFSALNTRLGYTDYVHREIEEGVIGTTFTNRSHELRMDLFHHPLADWRGALSLHYKRSKSAALGAEAFTPPGITETLALALMEERHFGDFLVQLGARLEQVDITSDTSLLHHDHDHEADHEVGHGHQDVSYRTTPVSVSAGAVWDFTPGYNVGLSLTHAQRMPSLAELLSLGPHLGSGLYEAGALLELHREDDEHFHFHLLQQKVQLEKSNNIDLSLRKVDGDVGFIINAFYNAIDDYYYLANSGAVFVDDHHHHDSEHEHHDTAEEGLPVYTYQVSGARLYGLEGQWMWQVAAPLKVTLSTDYIRATLTEGGNLPRIPPMRFGAAVNYQRDNYSLEFNAMHYLAQKKVAHLEDATSGYTLVDLQVNYHLDKFVPGTKLYVQGKNLTNEYARVHSSFLKDKAPLPGRALVVGLAGVF